MALVGVAGYAIAALALLGLSVLLAVGWEGRARGAWLIAATACAGLWSAVLASLAYFDSAPLWIIFSGETLKAGAWLMVLGALAKTGAFPRGLARWSGGAWPAALAVGVAVILFLPERAGSVVIGTGLLLALLGLVLLEQLYRNSQATGRFALRYLGIGLGGLFLYDIFLYSQGLLLGAISQDAWYARGYVMALAVPFLAIAARRNPEWSLRMFVSREVVFYATSFIAVGAYLLLMAAGGYAVQLLGGTWGAVGQIVFLAAALGLLAVLFGSTALRRRLRVFLVKHFYRNKYDYRQEWLRFIDTLAKGDAGEPAPVTAIRAVAQIIDSPGAGLLLRGEGSDGWRREAVWPVSELLSGAPEELAADRTLLEFLEGRQWVVDLAEYRAEPGIYEPLVLPSWLAGRESWRLIVPVLIRGRLYGMLLLREPPAGFQMTFEDRDLLKTAAMHIATHLAQHESEQRLAEAGQFAAFNKLSSFMMHDLKNAAAQLELVVANAEKHRRNPEFIDDAIDTVAGAAQRIVRLTEQLQRGEARDTREDLDLAAVVREAIGRLAGRVPAPELTAGPDGVRVNAARERLTSIVEHVLRNAQDAALAQGRVEVTVGQLDGQALVEVRDDGRGMTADFIHERLFRPFDSTKGSKGMGIGAYQAREYVRSLGGRVEVESAPNRGTTFRIVLPRSVAGGGAVSESA